MTSIKNRRSIKYLLFSLIKNLHTRHDINLIIFVPKTIVFGTIGTVVKILQSTPNNVFQNIVPNYMFC